MYFNCYLGQMFVSDVSDFQFVGKVEPYFLSAGEEVILTVIVRPVIALAIRTTGSDAFLDEIELQRRAYRSRAGDVSR